MSKQENNLTGGEVKRVHKLTQGDEKPKYFHLDGDII